MSMGAIEFVNMTKQDAAVLLVQLYADYSVLCHKCGGRPDDGTEEAVAMAVQALKEGRV